MKMKSLLGIMLSLSILQSCQNDETNGKLPKLAY